MGGVAVPCPAGTYGPNEGLQRLRDCTVCPAGIDGGKPFFLLYYTVLHPNTQICAIISVCMYVYQYAILN